MKNKNIWRICFVLMAALVMMGGLSVPAYAGGGDYYDELNNEPVPEETKKPQELKPLTPDGNMNLEDDISGEQSEDKQFIVVQSKGGNYFYIIIDKAKDGKNTVHFLNQVDEADLLALMDEKPKPKEPVASPEPEPAPKPEPEPEPEKSGGMGGALALALILALGGGGAFYYFKVVKPKQSIKGGSDLDDFDFEDEEEETELEAFEDEQEETEE
jgi:hypothetical protein